MKQLSLEEKISLCGSYTQMWGKLFDFFGEDGFQEKQLDSDAEAQFFRLVTELARKEPHLTYLIPDDFSSGEKVCEILKETVSLDTLQAFSETQFNKLQHDWHVVYIALNKCLGRLLQHRPLPKGQKAPKEGAEENAPSPAA